MALARRRIVSLIATSILALSVLPLLLTALLAAGSITRGLEADLEASLSVVAGALAVEAERALKPVARVFDTLGFFLATQPSPASLSAFLDATQRARSDLTAVLLLDARGRVVNLAPFDRGRLGEDFTGQPAYREARSRDGNFISQPHLSAFDGSMTVAGYRRFGDSVGVILLDLEDISLFMSRLRISDADHVALVDGAGRFIAHTSSTAVREQRYAEPGDFRGRGLVRSRWDGVEHLVARQAVRGTDWTALYYRDRREARSISDRFLDRLALLTLLATLLAAAAAAALGRALTRPFADIGARIREIGEGRYDKRITGDYPLELAEIAAAFNAMAERVELRDRELQRSEERYRALFFGSEVPAFLLDPVSGAIRDLNRAAVYYYGWTREELLSMRIQDINSLPPEEVAEEMAAAREQRRNHFNFLHRHKDGALRDVEVFSAPVEIEGVDYLYTTVFDVTERRLAEEQVQKDLEEKVILLKEIHHRVKNNLQIIASLLNLQARNMRDAGDAELFKTTEDRVFSMSLSHELLYLSQDLSSIDMADYGEQLVAYLRDAHPVDSLDLSLEAGHFVLPLEKAMPCGLILNELVSNSFKYAARSGSPRVFVRLRREAEGFVVLEVRDEGPGLPPGLDPGKSESLGLSLVTSLVRQLGGSIEWLPADPAKGRRPGLRVVIRFPPS